MRRISQVVFVHGVFSNHFFVWVLTSYALGEANKKFSKQIWEGRVNKYLSSCENTLRQHKNIPEKNLQVVNPVLSALIIALLRYDAPITKSSRGIFWDVHSAWCTPVPKQFCSKMLQHDERNSGQFMQELNATIIKWWIVPRSPEVMMMIMTTMITTIYI